MSVPKPLAPSSSSGDIVLTPVVTSNSVQSLFSSVQPPSPPNVGATSSFVFLGFTRRQVQTFLASVLTIVSLVVANLIVAVTKSPTGTSSSDVVAQAEKTLLQQFLQTYLNYSTVNSASTLVVPPTDG